MKFYLAIILVLFIVLLHSDEGKAQDRKTNGETSTPTASLLETYTAFKSDEASMIIDLLRNEVEKNPGSRGFIAVYCGKICKKGEIEAHIRGIRLALQFKNTNQKDFIVVAAGFKDVTTTEFWLVPKTACLPDIRNDFDPKTVVFKGVFADSIVKYECC